MHDGTLLLGPVLFQDFEVPDCITWGGAHRLAVHRLPGGERVIDALGRDDASICWSGVFTGADASVRARAVDVLRAGGGVWPLTWNTFFYFVVVAGFAASYERENWIPYRIVCTVLRDEAEAVVEAALDIASAALSDLVAAAGFGTSVDLSAATAALGVSGAATAGTAAYASATTALASASAAIGTGIPDAESALLGAGDPGTAADAAGTLAGLAGAQGYVQRAAANLANASS